MLLFFINVSRKRFTWRARELLALGPKKMHDLDGCVCCVIVTTRVPWPEGKAVLARHRLVHAALGDTMKDLHALSVKKSQTPAEASATPA